MTVCGIEITEMRMTWIMAIKCSVEVRIGRKLEDKEIDYVLLEAVRHLAKQAEPTTWLQ